MQCNTCQGSGALRMAGNQAIACPVCGGSGKDPFSKVGRWYEASVVVALNANGNVPITIVDYDFEIVFFMVVATSLNATCQITEATSGYQFIGGPNNAQAHLANVFGTAQNPFVLPVPFRVKKNSVISFSFTDLSGAQNTIAPCVFGLQDLNSK